VSTIGEAARQTGLKVTAIRFYEAEGLLPPPPRSASGQRLYSEADIRRLAFVRRARALGFELEDIKSLLDLTDHPARPCSEADAIARGHLQAVEGRIAQLTQLKSELARIVQSCAGGTTTRDCRVIESLTESAISQAPKAQEPPISRRRTKK
jgi:Cu(I)-responsive transcriptional regulator